MTYELALLVTSGGTITDRSARARLDRVRVDGGLRRCGRRRNLPDDSVAGREHDLLEDQFDIRSGVIGGLLRKRGRYVQADGGAVERSQERRQILFSPAGQVQLDHFFVHHFFQRFQTSVMTCRERSLRYPAAWAS